MKFYGFVILLINIYLIHSTAQRTVKVSNVNQLLNEISSNKRILLKQGEYSISEVDTSLIKSKNVQFVRKYDDGLELNITNIHDLELIGIGENKPLICNENIYSNIIVFNNCNKIRLINLEFGHYPEKGICIGGVVKLIECDNILIDNCQLFGSGCDGIAALNTNRLKCSNSVIKECTATILNLESCSNFKFTKSSFEKNGGSEYYSPYLIPINNCINIKFKQCNFLKNTTSVNPEFETNSSLIYIDGEKSEKIELVKCNISKNKAQYFAAGKVGSLKLSKVSLGENEFVYGKFEIKQE